MYLRLFIQFHRIYLLLCFYVIRLNTHVPWHSIQSIDAILGATLRSSFFFRQGKFPLFPFLALFFRFLSHSLAFCSWHKCEEKKKSEKKVEQKEAMSFSLSK